MWLFLLIIWIVTESSSDISAEEGGLAALAVVALHYLFMFYAASKGHTVNGGGFEFQLGGDDRDRPTH